MHREISNFLEPDYEEDHQISSQFEYEKKGWITITQYNFYPSFSQQKWNESQIAFKYLKPNR